MKWMLQSTAIQAASNLVDRLRNRQWSTHPIDRALGIETSARVTRRALASGNASDDLSVGYVGAQPSIIRKSLDLIGVTDDMAFIDLGCGKGRALAVAAEYPFASIRGIELSPYVFAVAKRNVNTLRSRGTTYARIDVLHGDATRPDLTGDNAVVLFLYNPFHAPVVGILLDNLQQYYTLEPERKIWIVYYNPVCFDLFDKASFLDRYYARKIDHEAEEAKASPTLNVQDSVVIYQSRNDPYRPPLPGAGADIKITIPNLGAEVQNPAVGNYDLN